jgi:hypothetical protein
MISDKQLQTLRIWTDGNTQVQFAVTDGGSSEVPEDSEALQSGILSVAHAAPVSRLQKISN